MPAVISDTTVLNYLFRIGQFRLLRLEFQRVLIPPAVIAELRRRPELKPLLDELIQRNGFRLSRKIYDKVLREAGELE